MDDLLQSPPATAIQAGPAKGGGRADTLTGASMQPGRISVTEAYRERRAARLKGKGGKTQGLRRKIRR